MDGHARASSWLVCFKGHFFLHLRCKEIIACKYFSGTDFLLEIAADSAPAVHIPRYLEAGPAFAPDTAPRRGGSSPLVLPPRRVASAFCRRMWWGCDTALGNRSCCLVLRCPSALFATSSNHVCGVIKHLLRTRFLGVSFFFSFFDSHTVAYRVAAAV